MNVRIIFNQHTAAACNRESKDFVLPDIWHKPAKTYVVGETYIGERGVHSGERLRYAGAEKDVHIFRQM